MFVNDFLPLHQLLDWVDWLSPELEEKYKIRSILIPRWKNFLSRHVDRFDRYPEMVTHGSTHICNVLSLAENMFYPDFISRKKHPSYFSGEELFLLIAGIFLHDIGMADISYGSVWNIQDIRRNHSVLSGKILKYRFKDIRSKRFKELNTENLLPTFQDENEVDTLAQICIHHQSKAPIAENQIKKGKSTAPSLEYLCKFNTHLELFNGKSIDIKKITALLRVLDACDNQYSRAGSIFIVNDKIDNNSRMQEECEEKKRYARDDLKTFFENYQKYLKDQEIEHFPKHCVIQRVWIVEREIVYKPISDLELELLTTVLPKTATKRETFVRDFLEDVEEEIHVCNQYLPPELNLKPPRIFNYKKDYIKIRKLSNIERLWGRSAIKKVPYLFNRKIVLDLEKYFESQAENPGIALVVGPEGNGKTTVATELNKKLEKKGKRVCFLSIQNLLPTRVEKRFASQFSEELLQNIIRHFSYFLASWGDYLFFNNIRMELDVEEGQWDILFRQLDQEEYIFLFDDMHLVSLYLETTAIYRFFYQFFQKIYLGKAKSIIFTQKIPHPFFVSKNLSSVPFEIQPFNEEELHQIVSQEEYIGFDPNEWDEGRAKTESLIRYYSKLPIVLDFIRKETKSILHHGDEAAQWFNIGVERHMREHISKLRGILDKHSEDLLHFLSSYPLYALPDYGKISKVTGYPTDQVENGWQNLKKRRLLKQSQNKGESWELSAWWWEPIGGIWGSFLKEIEESDRNIEILAEKVIPELGYLKGLNQGKYHHLDAWNHTVTVFKGIRSILIDPALHMKDGFIFPKSPTILQLAALLHDIGKPSCQNETENGIQFFEHEQIGADIAKKIGVRLRLSSEEIEYLTTVIRCHGRPANLIRCDQPISKKAIGNLIYDLGPFASDVFLLVKADLEASLGVQANLDQSVERLNSLMLDYQKEKKLMIIPEFQSLLNGGDLENLGLKPGPIFGELLGEAKEKQLSKELTNRDEALVWLKGRI
jgi:hypothetical protein